MTIEDLTFKNNVTISAPVMDVSDDKLKEMLRDSSNVGIMRLNDPESWNNIDISASNIYEYEDERFINAEIYADLGVDEHTGEMDDKGKSVMQFLADRVSPNRLKNSALKVYEKLGEDAVYLFGDTTIDDIKAGKLNIMDMVADEELSSYAALEFNQFGGIFLTLGIAYPTLPYEKEIPEIAWDIPLDEDEKDFLFDEMSKRVDMDMIYVLQSNHNFPKEEQTIMTNYFEGEYEDKVYEAEANIYANLHIEFNDDNYNSMLNTFQSIDRDTVESLHRENVEFMQEAMSLLDGNLTVLVKNLENYNILPAQYNYYPVTESDHAGNAVHKVLADAIMDDIKVDKDSYEPVGDDGLYACKATYKGKEFYFEGNEHADMPSYEMTAAIELIAGVSEGRIRDLPNDKTQKREDVER